MGNGGNQSTGVKNDGGQGAGAKNGGGQGAGVAKGGVSLANGIAEIQKNTFVPEKK